MIKKKRFFRINVNNGKRKKRNKVKKVKKVKDDTLFLEMLLVLFLITGMVLFTLLFIMSPRSMTTNAITDSLIRYKAHSKGIDYDDYVSSLDKPKREVKYSRVGRFYRSVLMTGGNYEIIDQCTGKDIVFETCVDEHLAKNPELRDDFNRSINDIKSTLDLAEKYGMNYGEIPFIKDLVGEN